MFSLLPSVPRRPGEQVAWETKLRDLSAKAKQKLARCWPRPALKPRPGHEGGGEVSMATANKALTGGPQLGYYSRRRHDSPRGLSAQV